MSSLAKEAFYNHAKRRITEIYPVISSPNFNLNGDIITTAGTLLGVIDSSGVRERMTTAAFSGAIAGIQGDSLYTRQMNIAMYFRYKLLQTSCRMFIGVADLGTGIVAGTNPVGNFAGVYFNELSGNLRFIRNNGGVMAETSLGAIDFGVHDLYMWIFKSGGGDRVTFQLDNGTRTSVTTSLPTNSTPMAITAVVRTNSGVARSLEMGKIHLSQES